MSRRVVAAVCAGALVGTACSIGPGPAPPAGRIAVSEAAPLPEPRTEVAGAAWHGAIVVAGGLRTDGTTSTRVDRWDPAEDAWSQLPDLPVPLHHAALVAYGDDLWTIGGYRPADGNWAPEGRTWRLGPGAGQWEPGPDLLLARGAPAAVVAGGELWVMGGVGHGGTQVATEFFDAANGGWAPGPSLDAPREHLAAALLDGRPLAIAGRNGGLDTNLLSTEVITAEDAVEPGPEVRIPRGGIAAATIEAMPCVAGGEAPGGTIAEVECLEGGAWEVVATLTHPRHGLAVVALDHALHVIGGGPEPGLSVSDRHEVLTFRHVPTPIR